MFQPKLEKKNSGVFENKTRAQQEPKSTNIAKTSNFVALLTFYLFVVVVFRNGWQAWIHFSEKKDRTFVSEKTDRQTIWQFDFLATTLS